MLNKNKTKFEYVIVILYFGLILLIFSKMEFDEISHFSLENANSNVQSDFNEIPVDQSEDTPSLHWNFSRGNYSR